jgi:geranylgeranylglycerol-phosphate geranylgeranyltransferase
MMPLMSRAPARVIALAQITRIDRSIVAAGYVCLGGYLAGAGPFSRPVIRGALVVLLIVCFGNVVNDCADVAVDTLAKPSRPLPAGAISMRFATWLAGFLAAGGVLVATTLHVRAVFVAVAAVFVAGAYSWWLKGTLLLGNFAVALLVANTVLYGGIAARLVPPAVIITSALILLFVLVQEVLFTLEDEEWDRLARVGTTANRLGPARTLALHRALGAAIIVVAFLPALLGIAPHAYLYALVPCVIVPTIGVLMLLRGTPSSATVRRAGWLTRLVWISGVVPLALLRGSG